MAFDQTSFLEAVAATEREWGGVSVAEAGTPLDRVLQALQGGGARRHVPVVAGLARGRIRAPRLETVQALTGLAGALRLPDPGRSEYALSELEAFAPNHEFVRAVALAALGREPNEEERAWAAHIDCGVKSRLEVCIHLFLRGRAEGRAVNLTGIPRGAGIFKLTRGPLVAGPVRRLVDLAKLPNLPRQLRLQDRASKLKLHELAQACGAFAQNVDRGLSDVARAVDGELEVASREIDSLRAVCDALQREMVCLRSDLTAAAAALREDVQEQLAAMAAPPAVDATSDQSAATPHNGIVVAMDALNQGPALALDPPSDTQFGELWRLQHRTLTFVGEALDQFDARLGQLERSGPWGERQEVQELKRRLHKAQRRRLAEASERAAALAVYVDMLLRRLQGGTAAPWLQVGSACGNFLDACKARGVAAFGAEKASAPRPGVLNEASCADPLAWVWERAPGSVGVVALLAESEIGESLDQLIHVCAASAHVLQPGGVLLIETVDRSEAKEATIVLLLEEAGFEAVTVFQPASVVSSAASSAPQAFLAVKSR